MKFSARNSDIISGLQPALSCSVTGAKSEWVDVGRISISATPDGLLSLANNGNVVVINKDSAGSLYKFDAPGTITVKTVDLQNVINSYKADEMLVFEVEGTELFIRPMNDPETLQSVPSELREIEQVNLASQYNKELTLERDILVNAMKKVAYAIGEEKFKQEFLYWVLRISDGAVRAKAGDGACIAVHEVSGENICAGTKKSLDIAFHRDYTPILQKLLPAFEDSVSIKTYSRSSENDSLFNQTVLESGSLMLVLIGRDPGIKWPDENVFFKLERPYRFTMSISELSHAMKGIMATRNDDVRKQNELHIITLKFDLETKVASLNASHSMKSVRKVNLSEAVGPEKTVEFRCISRYLDGAVQNAPSGFVQFELAAPKGPAYVRYHAAESLQNEGPIFGNVNASAGTKEQYTVFFAGFNKK